MDKKSQSLIVIFVIIIMISAVLTFYRYIIIKDVSYEIDEEIFQASLLEE